MKINYYICVMTKLISISISLVILMQNFGIGLNDISQLETFVEHAQFHSEQYGDNVFVFISRHYGELKENHSKEHQEEKEDHEQLPFSHNNCSHFSSVIAFIISTNKEEFKTPEISEFKVHNFFYKAPKSSLHKLGLIQPPQQS